MCFGLGVFPRLGVLFLTGECGIREAWRFLIVLGGSIGSREGLRLLLGESLFSVTTILSGLPRLLLFSMELGFLPP